MRAMARVIVCVWIIAAIGCGAGAGQAAGKVTKKGEPLPNAEITFASITDPQTAVHGASGSDGTYHLSYVSNGGLPPGKYQVTVAYYTLRNGKPLPDGEEGTTLRGDETKVLRHAVVFERDIATGPNPLDFEWNDGNKGDK